MENLEKETKIKAKSEITAIRVAVLTLKTISGILTKANRKSFGRKIKASTLVQYAISKITDADIKMLQEQSLSNADRMEIKYREFVRANGPISKDEFLGTLLGPNGAKSPGENAAVS